MLIIFVAGQKDRSDTESHGGGKILWLPSLMKSTQLGNVG